MLRTQFQVGLSALAQPQPAEAAGPTQGHPPANHPVSGFPLSEGYSPPLTATRLDVISVRHLLA